VKKVPFSSERNFRRSDKKYRFQGGGDFSNIWQSSLITGSLL